MTQTKKRKQDYMMIFATE